MKECWAEGDLRAYLDRELAPEAMEQAAAHLAECPQCSGLCEVLSARAQKVGAWMDALAEPVIPAPVRRSGRTAWKWLGGALAATAAIVIGIILAPHRTIEKSPVDEAPAVEAAIPPVVHPSAAVVQEAAIRPRTRRHPPAHRPAERTETFVALDSDPFDAGWVVRMALGPNQIPADVVFSADGRPRAYRLISDSTN